MEPPLSLVLRFGFRPISGVAEFFRPSNLRKGKQLVNAKSVYDVQEIDGTRAQLEIGRTVYVDETPRPEALCPRVPEFQLRPLTFYGRVPKGTTNVDICKELVKRFSPSELKCVQDFGAGRFEVTFATMAAVERFLDQSVVKVRNAEVKFEYRGVRMKTVRVLGYPADASDSALLNGLAAYGKVLGMDYEHVPEFKTVLTGNRRVRVEMARPVPNLLPVGSRIVQCEYDGVVRLCRRCFFPGHHAADCKVPQCERCAEFGHARCEAVCKRCGDDHALSACKVTSGAAEGQEAPSKGPEGSPLPETEPVRAEAPGGGEQGTRPELVRGKRRRARSSDSSDERPAAAACGGPGDLEEGLPGVKRTAAADSDSESTQSTVKGSTEGETSLFSSSCPYCGLGTCDGDCSPLSDRVYSSTHEDSSSDEEMDRVSLKGNPKYRDRKGDLELRELVDELGLVDAWRTLRPVHTRQGEGCAGRGSRSRIDRFYVSPSLVPSMHSSWLCSSALSDHCLLALRFADSNLVAQGKRPWRLNPRLLKDEEAAKDVAGLLCRSLLGGQDLGGSEWDAVKASVAECFREWGKRRAREERAEIKIVSDAILLLSKPLSGGPGVTAALTSLRKELRVLLQRRWDRLRATARAEQWEMEAWCSRNVLRRHLARKRAVMTSLTDPSTGNLVETQDGVLELARQFYKNLYAKSYEQVDICDSPLVEEELLAALKSMKRNRSPGSDGLTVEFYVKFWKVLGKPFTTLVNRLLREGTLSATQREGLITLLCKDESRRTDLRAWRPITLLNCDYKLIAKCLSVRLTPVLSTVLGPYQACCVPGRSCQLHGFAIRDLIEWANARNLSGILCSFDQEKAFDVISHRYLFKVLKEAGFSGQFISMVRALYSRPSSAVVIQDRISEPFDVGRGVRQGDPLSPALYVLAFEPLLQRLSSDNSIGRFPLPPGSPPVALFAYADDLSIVVPDEATVCTVLDVMEGYCSASGARIKRSKSVVMYLNSAPSSPRPVHGLPVQQRLRILGFHFEPDGLTTENWRLAKQKLTDRIQEIGALGCPLTARVTIIRSLLFSFLTYVASVMPVATRTKLVLEGLLFRFLWSGSSMYMARPVIKLPRNKGGLGIPDLGIVATALHLRWTRVALESDMLLTRSFASFSLSTRLRLFSPEAFSNSVPRAGTPSPFYAGAASTLARLRDANPGIELDSLELHDLVDLLTPDLPAHCVRYDLSRHSPNWKLITASFLDAKRATFMYRMARGCLPITFRPFTKIPTRGKCPFCGSREDLVHIFSQCALPAALLQRIASLYGHPGVPLETVRFLNPLPAQAVNQYVLLLVECSYQVWVARCAAVFDGRRPGLHEVLAKVRKEIWFVLHRERQRLGVKKFLETWHRPAVIFSESGGQITITF
ncbi:hypothetical protein HPB52_009014 [Rhipicephalus sanguineus]|uniref:Reverse transcriptase domain-containing protein n=1 Tax=Rhipicephalus sanguineus TaxID=34632 RepID=A0A9D4Q5S7_RHISA|nr:hypothetical protein HPB52_009014 [Rhipicephalus sanguineus]